jgi:hypothetical protein
MVRLAIASGRAVLLVGPPGTGKTEILRQVIGEFDAEPERFSLERPGVTAAWVTPEEEWTFDSLVLGETVSDDEIASVEGALLQAIAADEWLVLDEANRADMDRVLGGVLTWLSGKRVRIGTWRANGASVPAYLDWSATPTSTIGTAEDGGREYVAGADWRLLGTYNAVDAQRVFRMGQALSRRFKHVPIPPIGIEDFRLLIADFIVDAELAAWLVDRVTALYSAHLGSAEGQLGAGLFVDIPAYVEHGARLLRYDGSEDALETEDLLAEAYVSSVGAIAAKFEPDVLAEVGDAVLASGALSLESWSWVLDQLTAMRA